jgi:AsmA family protein
MKALRRFWAEHAASSAGHRTLTWVAGAAGLLLLGLALGEATGWPVLRQPMQRAMARAAGVPVQLDGAFRLSLLGSPSLRIGHLNVGAADGVPVPHLADATDVTLDWRWADLWRWQRGDGLRIQRLQARGLDAQLVRLADGRASWQIGRQDAPARLPSAALPRPRFGTLVIGDGHILVQDQALDTDLRIEVQGQEGDASPPSGRAPGAAGTPPPPAPAPAGYEATVQGRFRALPLKLAVRTGGALPLLRDPAEGTPDAALPIRVEGSAGASSLLFDGRASALLGERRLEGALHFRGPSLARVVAPLGITLPETPPFDLRGQLSHSGGIWHLRADRVAVGRSLLNGDFRYDTAASPNRLSGHLAGPRLALADLGPAVGATTGGEARAGTDAAPLADRRVLPRRRFDLPSLQAMDADVQVAIDELDFGSSAVAPLRQLQTHLLLQGGVLRLEALQAVVAGGHFSGETQLDGRVDPARWAADLRFAGIDVEGWLRGVQTGAGQASAPASTNVAALKRQRTQARQGGEQTVRAYVTGELGGRIQVKGVGRSTADILASLDGQAQASLKDGSLSHLATELSGIDLAQALGVWVRGDRPLPLRCARLDVVLRNGVVQPRLAVIDNKDSTIHLSGQVDLRDESLALRATVQPKDFSPLALRAPLTVSGTLGAPHLGVDAKRLTGKALGAAALGAVVAPLAALLPLMDLGQAPKDDPCAEAPQTPPEAAQAGKRAGPASRSANQQAKAAPSSGRLSR